MAIPVGSLSFIFEDIAICPEHLLQPSLPDSKKVHCLKCGANRFLSQALPKKPKKAKTEEKPTSVVSDSDIDSDSNGDQ